VWGARSGGDEIGTRHPDDALDQIAGPAIAA
jgi:hypothetical protein